MAFTHDPDTDEGLLRTLIGDTDSSDYELEDNELTAILDLNSSDLWASAADSCRRLAAKYAKEAIKIGLGKQDIDIDKRKKAEYFLSLAKMFEGKSGNDVTVFEDSYNYSIDSNGIDRSEYIGDDV